MNVLDMLVVIATIAVTIIVIREDKKNEDSKNN